MVIVFVKTTAQLHKETLDIHKHRPSVISLLGIDDDKVMSNHEISQSCKPTRCVEKRVDHRQSYLSGGGVVYV